MWKELKQIDWIWDRLWVSAATRLTCSSILFYIIYGSSVQFELEFKKPMDLRSTITSAFPSQPVIGKIWQSYSYIHTHRHFSLFWNLSSLFVIFAHFHITFYKIRSLKCLRRKHIRNFTWVYSVWNISLKNRCIFPLPFYIGNGQFPFFFLKQDFHGYINIWITGSQRLVWTFLSCNWWLSAYCC